VIEVKDQFGITVVEIGPCPIEGQLALTTGDCREPWVPVEDLKAAIEAVEKGDV
jgi:hypothetical protein